ncbi:MAG: SprT-like domain-containing protein [Nanoarchaeota archaeon]|nr:SprT-like domain-containing protein [Nanoarchaeota archaeon]MBU1027935.1 SprT-like domain-containing protein [Nanoarchaeota archaeon]
MKYTKENTKWKEEKEMKVSNEQAEMIVKKLAKHFKLPIRHVYFRQCRTSTAYRFGGRIKFWNNPDIGTICHEVCHFYCWKKFGSMKGDKVRHGSKKWLNQMKIVMNYAKKKNYWKEELERRTQPKQPKPEPTKEEVRKKKIERLETSNKRHQTKIKRCTTLIKKNNRRISALKRFI